MPAVPSAGFLRHSRRVAAGGAAHVWVSASRQLFAGADGGVGTVGKVARRIYGVNYVGVAHVPLGALMALLMCVAGVCRIAGGVGVSVPVEVMVVMVVVLFRRSCVLSFSIFRLIQSVYHLTKQESIANNRPCLRVLLQAAAHKASIACIFTFSSYILSLFSPGLLCAINVMHDTGGAVCADVLTFYLRRFRCFKLRA